MQSRWDIPWGSPSRPDDTSTMRIGDAERNEMSELLSKHYSDGRLDAAEFQERLDKAMSAKTKGDLDGLLTDLPNLKPPVQSTPPPPRPARHRPRVLRVVLFVFIVLWMLSLLRGVFWFGWLGFHFFPWPLIVIGALFLWSRERRHRGYRYRREPLEERPQ